MIKGNDNYIPIRVSFIHQAGLQFPISSFLKKMMAHCGLTFMLVSINFVKIILVVDALMQREGMPFSAFDFLNVYNVVRPKCKPGTNLYLGNH